MNNLYYAKLEEYQAQRATSGEVVNTEKQQLGESVRRLEVLGAKLDYELNVLLGRVAEVEDGVGEFERRVRGVEGRVGELVGGWEGEESTEKERVNDGGGSSGKETPRSGADGDDDEGTATGTSDAVNSESASWWQRVVNFVGSKKD